MRTHSVSMRETAICAAMLMHAVFYSQAMTFSILHSFHSPPDGPWAGLVQSGDGNFYGVTDSGGTTLNGTIFRMTSNGVLTVIYNFQSTNGSGAEGKLAIGLDGHLYGVTYFGGPTDN